jgi:hypothetical protein
MILRSVCIWRKRRRCVYTHEIGVIANGGKIVGHSGAGTAVTGAEWRSRCLVQSPGRCCFRNLRRRRPSCSAAPQTIIGPLKFVQSPETCVRSLETWWQD